MTDQFKSIQEVLADKSFQELDVNERKNVLSGYFDEVIAPQVIQGGDDVEGARSQFIQDVNDPMFAAAALVDASNVRIQQSQKARQPNFPLSDDPIVRNVVDPFFQAGTEVAKGFHRGSAAAVTPGAMVLKAAQVPEKYNIFEQSRVANDKAAERLPRTYLDPVSKFAFEQGAAMPGYTAAFEQVAAPVGGVLKTAIPKLQGILKNRALVQQTKQTKQEAGIAEKFIENIHQARRNVGGEYESYLKKFGDEKLTSDQMGEFNKLLEIAPKALVEEMKFNNTVAKVINNRTKELTIVPTLKNLKAIRDIVKGDVSTKYWNSKLVDDVTMKAGNYVYEQIGKLMRSGRKDLGNIMGKYSEVMDASRNLFSKFQDKTGMTRSKIVPGIYKKGADNATQQAIDIIEKYNPNMKIPKGEALKLAKNKEFREMIGKVAPWLTAGGAAVTGLGILGSKIKGD